MPLQILSFRVKLRCVPSKMLGRQVVARVLKGKVLQGFIFFLWLPLNFFFFVLHQRSQQLACYCNVGS